MRRALGIMVAALLALAGAPTMRAPDPPPVLVNETPSVPQGLYLRVGDDIREGRVVALRQPASARSYLAGLGAPPDMRLLKRVAAVGGETVCAAPGVLRWPGGAVAVLTHDRQGRALPAWPGCRALAPDELLLLGRSAASFDSRYFGPVRRRDLDGVYRAVVRW